MRTANVFIGAATAAAVFIPAAFVAATDKGAISGALVAAAMAALLVVVLMHRRQTAPVPVALPGQPAPVVRRTTSVRGTRIDISA